MCAVELTCCGGASCTIGKEGCGLAYAVAAMRSSNSAVVGAVSLPLVDVLRRIRRCVWSHHRPADAQCVCVCVRMPIGKAGVSVCCAGVGVS